MRLFRFGYDIAIHLYLIGMLPKVGWDALFHRKYRSNFLPRLGVGFPEIKRDGRPLVWIHAVSLGETRAIIPLVNQLKERAQIILSTTTETGHAEGKKQVKADYHVYLPFDLPYLIRPIVKKVAPDLLLLTETDFWFHFQDAAREKGSKLILINGKMSDRSFRRYKRFPGFLRHLVGPFDHYYVQGQVYKERFLNLGIPEEKITLSGNIKLDGQTIQDAIPPREHFVLTLGSTHDPEEALWMDAIQGLPVKVYLVPRHPERFDKVASLLSEKGISFGRWSEQASFDNCQVILVDAMGQLKQCYQRSHLAFVGGSLTARVGGHNILEPSCYGVPVLYGPEMWGQPDLLNLMERYRAGREVQGSTLREVVIELMNDPEGRREMGERGKRIFSEASGALQTVMLGVKKVLC